MRELIWFLIVFGNIALWFFLPPGIGYTLLGFVISSLSLFSAFAIGRTQVRKLDQKMSEQYPMEEKYLEGFRRYQ